MLVSAHLYEWSLLPDLTEFLHLVSSAWVTGQVNWYHLLAYGACYQSLVGQGRCLGSEVGAEGGVDDWAPH